MVDHIKELEDKIAALQGNQTSSLWGLLDDRTKSLTKTEIDVINSNDDVKQSRKEMFDAFIMYYLFAKYRDGFANMPAFRPICEKYINSVLLAKDNMLKQNADLLSENERLKAEINKLRGSNGQ